MVSLVNLFEGKDLIPASKSVMISGQPQKQIILQKKDTSMVKRLVGHRHLGQVTRGQHRVDRLTRGQHSIGHSLSGGQHRFSHIKSGIQGFEQVTRGQYCVEESLLKVKASQKNAVSRYRYTDYNNLGASMQQEAEGRIMLDHNAAGFSNFYHSWTWNGCSRLGPKQSAVLASLYGGWSYHNGSCAPGIEREPGNDISIPSVNGLQPREAGLQEDRCFYDPG